MGTFKILRRAAMAGLLASTAFAGIGQAGVIYGVTAANGATATADFTFGANALTILLTNTTIDPNSVAENVSALTFTFAGGTGGALTGASSPFSRTVNRNGTYTQVAGPVTVAGIGWVYSQAVNTYKLDVLAGVGHAGPENTIIGLPAGTGEYDDANGSIAGNGPHNPFLATSATFNLAFASGVSAFSVLSAVSFQVGTADGNFISGACISNCGVIPGDPVPEPSALALIAMALLSMFAFGWLLRRRPAA